MGSAKSLLLKYGWTVQAQRYWFRRLVVFVMVVADVGERS